MKPSPLWTVRLGRERRVRARTPVFADDAVYQVFHYDKKDFIESVLLALDAETGAERWRATVEHVANEPIVAPDGTIYLCSFEGAVFAYDKGGRALWKAPDARSNMGVPALAGTERLVVAEIGGGGHRTWCLDARSGAVLWTFDNGGHSYPIAATAETVVHATAVDGTKFGESTIHLFALSAKDGRRLWSTTHGAYLFMPMIVDDIVVIGARGALLAYGLADGRLTARLDVPPDAAVTVVTRSAGGVLIADDAGTLRRVALDRKRSFLELWAASLPRETVGRPIDLGATVATLVEGGDLHVLAAGDGRRVAVHSRKGDASGAGGIACSGPLLAIANGRTLDVHRQSDLTGSHGEDAKL